MKDKKNQTEIMVLHVDKEPNFLALSQIFLEKKGFRVDTAHSVEEGFELLKGSNYDVVL
jgi:DNA-binding response OmpR family regulator